MIYVYSGSKFKLTKYRDSEHLRKVFNLNYLDDAKGLDKRVGRGYPVYCWVSPYHSVINQREHMYWSITPEEAENDFHDSAEEI